MDIGFLHTHVLVVTLFLLFYLFKVVLLLINKKQFLNRFRQKTKILDSILGTLILLSGGYLWYKMGSMDSYIMVKLLALLVMIPLGIVGLKKEHKGMALISALLLIYTYGIAEAKSFKFKKDPITVAEGEDLGKVIYQRKCIQCHGESGDKGLFKAKDLRQSQLTRDEKINLVLEGKGNMRSYQKELSEQDVEAVVDYVEAL